MYVPSDTLFLRVVGVVCPTEIKFMQTMNEDRIRHNSQPSFGTGVVNFRERAVSTQRADLKI